VLFYVKGGGAVVGDKYGNFVTDTGVPVTHASETRWGGAVGAGLEFGFVPGWSLGVEYDHLFLGSRDLTFTGQFLDTVRIKQDIDMGLVRLNYRFGGPVVARY
jgi:outer membrane immunogenic protein